MLGQKICILNILIYRDFSVYVKRNVNLIDESFGLYKVCCVIFAFLIFGIFRMLLFVCYDVED